MTQTQHNIKIFLKQIFHWINDWTCILILIGICIKPLPRLSNQMLSNKEENQGPLSDQKENQGHLISSGILHVCNSIWFLIEVGSLIQMWLTLIKKIEQMWYIKYNKINMFVRKYKKTKQYTYYDKNQHSTKKDHLW